MGIAASDRPIGLVTGANRGLGLETSNQLRAQGFRVVLTSRKESAGIAAARKLDPDGKDVVYHQLDVTDRQSISALAGDLPSLASRLDVLVNNAGIGSWGADRRQSIRTIETNYFGSRDVTDALLPFIPHGGRIVMVSSGLGELSYLSRDLRSKFADPSLTRDSLDTLVASYMSALESGDDKAGDVEGFTQCAHPHLGSRPFISGDSSQLSLPGLGAHRHGRPRGNAERPGRRSVNCSRRDAAGRHDRRILPRREENPLVKLGSQSRRGPLGSASTPSTI